MFKVIGVYKIFFLGFTSKFLLIASSLFIFSSPSIFAQDSLATVQKIQAIANGILKDATFNFVDKKSDENYRTVEVAPSDALLIPVSVYNDWRYWNGVLNIAMLRIGKQLNNPEYINFPLKNVEFCFDNYKYFKEKYNNEGKWNYPFGQFFIMEELDDGGAMGASVIEVYKSDPQERYKEYVNHFAEHILKKQTRLNDGTLVRTFPKKYTLWADDLYMSISFLSRMGGLNNDNRYFDDAAKQVINFNKYLFNEEKGLMYHCWYSDIKCPGVAFWGRANGWALLAQVDLLDRLPKDHPQRKILLKLLRRHIIGISRYQGIEGLWHQLLDKTDSFLETSCTAMFTYAIARAVNKGYIDSRYASIAERGWEGIMAKIHPDGKIEGVCAGTGVSNDLVFYYKRPTPLNDVHGIGTVLLAGSEILSLLKYE
jgi:unsaturated rhamnogalacturonyl hydrolase